MKKVLTCFFLSLFFISCGSSQDKKEVTTITLKTILEKEKVQLLDVRTPKEIEEGFIETAFFVNFFDTDFYTKASSILDKNKPVYVYCKSGGRSSKASKILLEKGFEVYNFLGGYSKWKTEN